MSHEIYYTSAPEGLKRGTSGFSTVGASDNIPRALWDRLEALSAYRHHFPPSASSGQNPVSHAHWLLNVAGTTYHVLSRICDSGVDHTQRTNAFAHHLVVDNGEMAPAGPAWMLRQPGVMRTAWDGNVGPISPHGLPRGDDNPSICRAWERATGDAGWGGHLADLFIKTPTKPVCILFGPGQDVLPLLAETIALLPPMVRWNVTFNTYFTSMPTSATCVWRCCLAGTPAADLGLRYAGGGVVIDLSDRSRLGQISSGPYVTMARTGQPPAGVAKTVAAPRPAPIKPTAPARPTTTAPAAAATPSVSSAPPVPPVPPPAPEPFFESPPEPLTQYEQPMPIPEPALPLPAAATTTRPLVSRRVTPIARQADASLKAADTQAAQAAAQRRKQLLILFFGALGAMALGMLLIYLMRGASPSEAPLAPPKKQSTEAPAPPPVAIETPPAHAPVTPPPQAAPAPIAKVPAPPPPQVQTPVVPAPSATPAKKYSPIVYFSMPLSAPVAGGAISDYKQSLTFSSADLETQDRMPAVQFHFPNGKSDYTTKDNHFHIVALSKNHTVSIYSQDLASSRREEICIFMLERYRSTLEIRWKTPMLVRQPESVALVFWLLQTSSMEIQGNSVKSQELAFKPWDSPTIRLSDASTDVTLPMPLPKDAVAAAPANLPAGWKGTWYTDAESKDPTLRKPDSASQVIKFEKATTSSGAVESWFLLTFRPGFTKVESNLAKRIAADTADQASAESDLRALNTSIDEWKRLGVKDNDPQLQPYLEKQKDNAKLVDAYKEALAGYKDLTTFDVPVEMGDGTRLTMLHVAAAKQNP